MPSPVLLGLHGVLQLLNCAAVGHLGRQIVNINFEHNTSESLALGKQNCVISCLRITELRNILPY